MNLRHVTVVPQAVLLAAFWATAFAFMLTPSLGAQITALGGDFTVNSYFPGPQFRPVAAGNSAGEAVVAWAGRRPFPLTQTEQPGIFAQRIGADGQPVGPELAAVWLDGLLEAGPEVAMGSDGTFVVVWSERDPETSEHTLFVSRYLPTGAAQFTRQEVDAGVDRLEDPTVAMAPAGSIVVGWVRSGETADAVYVRAFKLDGEPWGAAERISGESSRQQGPSIAALLDNRYVIAWASGAEDILGESIVARFLGFDGVVLSEEVRIDSATAEIPFAPSVTVVGPGSFAVAWEESPDGISDNQVFARIFDDKGFPRTFPFPVSQVEAGAQRSAPSVAGGSGRLLVTWNHLSPGSLSGTRPALRAFDQRGFPLSPQIFANSFDSTFEVHPRLASLGADRFLGTWQSGLEFLVAPPLPPGIDGDRSGIAGRLFDLSSDRLHLNRARFQVEVDWRDSKGNTGRGHAIALSEDTGYFWFFNRDNVELTVKILDGGAINNAFWVFYGSLTNVEFTLKVADTGTGLQKSYFNPQGRLRSIADTTSFPVNSPFSALAASAGAPEAALALHGASPFPVSKAAGSCASDLENLCLNGDRFRLKVDWRDPRSGASGQGTAVALTGDTGYFWFFNPNNVELVIKVLDGRPVNGNFWVFFGALSDLEYTITVTDTETGAERIYFNPPFTLTSFADTTAFR